MALDDKTLKLCNCNQTMALDAKALVGALKLKQPIEIHTELCRKQVASFHGALKDEACVIACTQEAPLFSELADQAGSTSDIKFVNIREHAGWSKEGAKATPKIAALLAANTGRVAVADSAAEQSLTAETLTNLHATEKPIDAGQEIEPGDEALLLRAREGVHQLNTQDDGAGAPGATAWEISASGREMVASG